MKVVIAGGSGFLGSALSRLLNAEGHSPVVLSRSHPPLWAPDGTAGAWARELEGARAVINLAGESIADRRWSATQKERLRLSRILATRSLTTAIRGLRQPPAVFISASAVGYYGDRGEEALTEASSPGSDFLARLCQEWEAEANAIASITRVVLLRTGIVLDRHQGALAKMLLPFRLFAGGPVGSGRQYMSWIHRDDHARLVLWAISQEGARGALNGTAPAPVTNAEFAKALGRAMNRPSVLPAPAFALRLALGEMADALLLSSQRALPVRASDLGFQFHYGNIDEALAEVLK